MSDWRQFALQGLPRESGGLEFLEPRCFDLMVLNLSDHDGDAKFSRHVGNWRRSSPLAT